MKARVGARNLETLRQRIDHCVVRRIRQDVLDQFPGRTDTRVPVAITAEQREEHDSLNQPIAHWRRLPSAGLSSKPNSCV